ncbi:hypothetical protein PFISCL1PPCAC_26061, partial [Pristionchus fissidentatus]
SSSSSLFSSFPSSNRQQREATPPFAALRQRGSQPVPPPSYQEFVRDVSPGLYQRSFNQRVLKERSPPSSTALVDLLQRYPSARASVLSRSLTGQLPNDRPVTGARPDPYPYPNHNQARQPDSYSDYRSAIEYGSIDRHSGGSYGSSDPYTTPSDESPRSSNGNQDAWEHPYSSTSTLRQPLDVSVLDDLISSPSSTMSRSTNEWRSSFERAQHHFRSRPTSPSMDSPPLANSSHHHHLLLPKSASATSISERSLLADAVSRADARETRADGRATPQLNEFWSAT